MIVVVIVVMVIVMLSALFALLTLILLFTMDSDIKGLGAKFKTQATAMKPTQRQHTNMNLSESTNIHRSIFWRATPARASCKFSVEEMTGSL